jgi:hypothetical protein
MKYRKSVELTFGKKTNKPFKLKFRRIGLEELIADTRMINHTHLVYGASQSGKTMFITMLIRLLIESNRDKYGLIILSKTDDALIKFSFLDQFFKNSSFTKNIIKYDNIEDFISFYERISKEQNKRLQDKIKKKNTDAPEKSDTVQDSLETNSNKTIKDYVLLMDDFAAYLKLKSYGFFYDVFFPNKRHSNFTVFYSLQMIQFLLQSIKMNTDSISIVGELSHNDCNTFYGGFTRFAHFFKNKSEFETFNDQKYEIFKEYTIFIFKKSKFEKQILYHVVSKQIVEMFKEFEKKMKTEQD